RLPIPLRGEEEVSGLAGCIHHPIQVPPLPAHPHIRRICRSPTCEWRRTEQRNIPQLEYFASSSTTCSLIGGGGGAGATCKRHGGEAGVATIREQLAQEGFTDKEAEEIFLRATELQSQVEQLGERMRREVLEDSAAAAGIPREFVEQAIQQLKAERTERAV